MDPIQAAHDELFYATFPDARPRPRDIRPFRGPTPQGLLPASMPPHKPTTAEEITALAAKIRVADPTVDNGEIDPRMKTAKNPQEQLAVATDNLRGKHHTLRFRAGQAEECGNSMASRTLHASDRKYVMTHFNLGMGFTQPEVVQGLPGNPPKGPAGNWVGTKQLMCQAAIDITGDGGRETPFVVYYNNDVLLIIEILDVKRILWPKPSPEVPLVVVRYSYMEGCPEGGSQFLIHLESRLRKILPRGTSEDNLKVRVELEKHLHGGIEASAEHILMLARLLSHNSELVDKEWANDQQAVEEIETGKARLPLSHNVLSVTALIFTPVVLLLQPQLRERELARAQARLQNIQEIANNPASLPKDTLYIPVRAYIHWVIDFGFANEQESVKMGGPPVDEPPHNEYRTKRFICRAVLANAGKGQWDPDQGKVVYYDEGAGTAIMYDRRRSIIVRLGPQEPAKALMHGAVIPFHDAGYR
ncbi:hypothetical protein C8J57DRAFT_1721091 [Mycena rebaudengoi]|nr:hypothetical protein C8J57DRAFT_1721091 [Mycena rebaudengoi]